MSQILSIQSAVAYGYAGNSAAIFPLRRVGVDAWPVLTVNFSNHSGYGALRGPTIAPADVLEVVKGIDDRGRLSEMDAVLSGYMGVPAMGATILAAVDLVRERNPEVVYCCDPVMGDVDRGFYAAPGIPEVMRDEATPRATIMVPNLFELEFLTDSKINSHEDLLAAINQLRARGPRVVVVTSAQGVDDDFVRMVAVDDSGVWEVTTPMLQRKFTGSGDLTTAMFLARWLKNGGEIGDALSATASIVYSVLKKTDEINPDADLPELELVAAQEELVNPSFTFTASKLS